MSRSETTEENRTTEQSISKGIWTLSSKSDICKRNGSAPRETVLLSTTANTITKLTK
jgi:hypothetical protein